MRNIKNTPEGTRDILFEECERMRLVETALTGLFSTRGYHEVITPGIEFFDVFSTTGGYIPPQSMFKLTDNNGRLMVLRPDCTVPIARMAATRLRAYPLPLRLFYNQHLYRSERMLSGRNSERVQAGVELIGAAGRRADLELLSLAMDTFQLFPAVDFRLEIGHIGLFNALAAELDAPDDEREILRGLIEQKNYTALNEKLQQYNGSPAAESLRLLPQLFGGGEVFEKAATLLSPSAANALAELEAIYRELTALGGSDRILIDCGMVQSNHYYTGVIFRGYIKGAGESVLSGGRYDDLLADYGSPQPATGFAVDVDVLAQLLPIQKTADDKNEILIFAEDGHQAEALRYLSGFKSRPAEYSVFDSFKQTLTYAKERQFAELHVVGDSILVYKEGEF